MAKASLDSFVRYRDRILRTAAFQDYDGEAHGLQVENRGTVNRIAATIDASLVTARLAVANGRGSVSHYALW